MNFDQSKENIQPLRGGRNVSQLDVALQAQTNQEYQRELQQQRLEFERLISEYTGNDPLENWYNYISWIEQSYPKHGHEGNLLPLLEQCLAKFEYDKRYTNDRRFCRLWIKYIDAQKNPFELYHMMHSRGLGRGCADLYRAWAYYHEAAGDFQNANHVFECGKRELAQPYEELENAHKNLIMAAGRHMLYGADEQKLVEKRQALTSLHSYKHGKVGSIRQSIIGVQNINPTTSATTSSTTTNVPINIYNGREEILRDNEAPPVSLLLAANRQDIIKEDTLKPGPWTTVPVKKQSKLATGTSTFVVHEDFDNKLTFPLNTLETYTDWIVSLTLPEPKDPRMIAMYPKDKVYSQTNTEFSLEELRSLRYTKKFAPNFSLPHEITQQQLQQISVEKVASPINQQLLNNSPQIVEQPPPPPPQLIVKSNSVLKNNQNSTLQLLNIWDSPSPTTNVQRNVTKFSIYEQTNLGIEANLNNTARVSAMKTPFNDLNADELAETGSRGGMDIAAAAPVDSAKRLPIFDDDTTSSSNRSFDDDIGQHQQQNIADLSCNTQIFNFNLNEMHVSTPENKLTQNNNNNNNDDENSVGKNSCKQLFGERAVQEKALSVILEETKSYGQSSSSSFGTTTKSSNQTRPNMATISEEHHNYLAQNLKANAELRSSLLGNLMDFETQPVLQVQSPINNNNNENHTPTPTKITPIDYIPSDPFKPALIKQLLKQVGFNNWNPTLGGIFTACKSDGSLGVYELKQPGVSINELPPASATTCFRWSPKGKQIAVGSKDGKITQYKPDLKAVKVINAPPFKSIHSLIGLEWISSSQFIGIFQSQNVDDPVNVVVIETPKTGTPSFINYDDICYSNGNTRPTQFYTILQRNWNILMVASSNSMEVGVLSSSNDIWTQWIMGDASRAELPLNDNREESLPIGFALNTSNQQEIPWGESNLPPTPILLLLSHFGTLCCFNVINLKEGLPNICSPPDPIVQTINPNLFTIKSVAKTENVPQQQQQVPKAVTFGNLTNQVKAQEIPKVSQSSPFSVNQSTPIANKISTASAAAVAVTATTSTPTPKNPPKVETPQLNETLQKVESQAEIDAETEKLFAQMVREECIFLESEIKNLLSRCKSVKINVGSDSDKTTIVQLTSIIDEFLKEMVDITTGQNAEVHSLKQNLLQSFAWYEEAKSRFNATQDEKLSILQRAQPLDSASEKQLADLRHSSYYLESQLTQAHRALDEQWENFQDYCRKTYKIKMPTMEAIFQTMVNQMAIIQKQSYVLKDIACRIKQRSRQPIGPTLLINVEDPKELENELKRLTLEPESIQQIQIEFVKNRLKYFTKTKTDNLRNFLQNRKIPNITPIKPQITNTSIQQSSASKLKQLSLLGAKLSPVSKDIVKKLDFTQSTPKTIQETTPIENLEKFTQKFEQNSLKLLDKTVTPSFTTKTTLPSGPNSAFVPTSLSIGPIATTTVVLTNAPTSKPVISVSNVKTTSSFGVSSAEVSKPFTFNFVNKTTPTTAAPITTPKTSLFTFTTQPTTVSTTAAAKTFTFNFGDKNVAATNTVFKPTTTTASVFGLQNNKPTVFGEKPLFTSLAPATIPATTSTIKSTASLFGSATVATAKPTTETVSIAKATPSTTTATTLFGNVSFAPKTTVATIGQSTIFVAPKTTATIQPSTKPSLTITPVTPTTSQQTPIATTTTTPTAPATLIFTSKPSITTTVVATTTVATPAIVTVASVKAISTAASSSTPSLASVAPTIKPILTVPSVVATNTSTTQPLNLVTSTKSSSFTPVTTQTSIFASVAPVATTQSIFGSVDKSKSLFGTTAITTASIFGNTNTSSASKSIFGSAPVFGSSAPSFPTSSIVGASTPTTTTQSVFGTSPITTTSTSSIFGGATPITTTSIFGGTAPTTSTTSIFGAAVPTTTTTTTTASVFGGFVQPTTTTKSVFGTTPATTGSIFGGAVSTSVAPSVFGNAPSTFGGAATPTTQFGSTTFGAVPATTAPFSQQSSVFGQSPVFGANTSFGSTPSSFGAVAPASTTNSFSFGQSSGSIFGNATTTSSGSIFGNTTTTSSGFGGSVFGGSGSVSSTTPFGATAPASGVFATTQPLSFSFTAAAAAATNSGATSGFGFGSLNHR